MSKLKELLEKRATLQQEFNELDIVNPQELTTEQEARFEAIFADVTTTDEQIKLEERKVAMRAELSNVIDRTKDAADPEKRHMESFARYLSGGATQEDLKFMQTRAAVQTVTTGGGGYTVPQGFADFLEIAEKFYNPFTSEQGFTIYVTEGGNDIPFPTLNDTAVEAYQIDINTNAETSATALTFAQPITMKAYKFTSGMIQIPQELIEDSAFNIMQVVADALGERMGRGKAKAFTTGAGSTAPHGLATKIKATSGLRTLPASNTALTRDDFVNLMYSVDIAYRNKPSCKWMLNDAVLKRIALLSIGSNDDRPLWQPSMIVGIPSTIEGVPYIVNNYMASTLEKTALSVIFGDMSKYVIRQVRDRRVRVLNERYGEFDQTGIVMWERFDGQLLDAGTNPIKGAYHNRT